MRISSYDHECGMYLRRRPGFFSLSRVDGEEHVFFRGALNWDGVLYSGKGGWTTTTLIWGELSWI